MKLVDSLSKSSIRVNYPWPSGSQWTTVSFFTYNSMLCSADDI